MKVTWTLLREVSCEGNMDTVCSERFLVKVTWTLLISCAGNLDRFLVKVTQTLFGQKVTACLERFLATTRHHS